MKMNNKILLIILSLGIISCTNDLDQYSETSILANNYYQTEENVEATITAAYNELQALYDYYLILFGEIPSDNAYIQAPNSNAGARPLEDFSWTTTSGFVGSIWENAYEGIFDANTVLEVIEEVNYESEDIKNTRIGEMYFMRAFLYDQLTTIYGEVPLTLSADSDPSSAFDDTRTSLETLFEQIENDLNEAINLLPVNNTIGRVDQYTARAILAKYYMKQQNFQQAKNQLEVIVNSGKYSLVPIDQLYGVENEGNREDVFSVQYASDLDGMSEGNAYYYEFTQPDNEGGRGSMAMEASLYNLYEEGDLRKSLVNQNNNVYYINKWSQPPNNNTSDGGSNHFVVRYADVLLLYAECLNETGSTNQAATYLNSVRERANLAETQANSQNEMREAIAKERRLELVGEGHRWYDLLRGENAIEIMNSFFQQQEKSLQVGSHRLLIPIPQSEVDNTKMKQNPGY